MSRYNRKEYSDLQPVGQDAQELDIVSIRYSDEFRETFNYFRGILATQEKSERALRITTHAINLNSNNYSVWDYRRQILKAIKYDLQKELFYVDYLIKESPGNHLIWHHRRLIANSCLSFVNLQNELDLTEIVLKDFSKCYNAWEHRQWIIDTFKYSSSGLPRQELEFTKNLIQDDLRNNSAWNQRFFILKKLGTADFELIKQEIDFALDCLVKVLDNETAWTYLKGLLKHFGEKNLRQLQKVVDFVEDLFYEQRNRNRHLIAFLIDLKIETVLDIYESNEINQSRKIKELCDLMANQYDKTRQSYWKFVYKQFYFDKIKSRYKSDESGTVGNSFENKWNKSYENTIESKKINKNFINLSFEIDNKLNDSFLKNCGLNDFKSSTEKNEIKKKKKRKTPERTIKIGTDLLYGLINKYNSNCTNE